MNIKRNEHDVRCGLCNLWFHTVTSWQDHMDRLHFYVKPLMALMVGL